VITNREMRRLLEPNPGAAEIDVPTQFKLLVAGGFKQVESCFFLRALFTDDYATGLVRHLDETGYECAVNSVHIEDYFAPGTARESAALASIGRACATFLAMKLRVYASEIADPTTFRVIVTVAGRSSTIRFHSIRVDQSWLAANIDGYQEGVLVIDSTDSDTPEAK
jgi:hypothetical protein